MLSTGAAWDWERQTPQSVVQHFPARDAKWNDESQIKTVFAASFAPSSAPKCVLIEK
jgi:hypothetical protein